MVTWRPWPGPQFLAVVVVMVLSASHRATEGAPATTLYRSFAEVPYVNRFTSDLPGDSKVNDPRVRTVNNALYSRVRPVPIPMDAGLHLVAVNHDLATRELCLNTTLVSTAPVTEEGRQATQKFVDVVGGSAPAKGMDPAAQRYGGHQFGHWADQLGDGRAHWLGEAAVEHCSASGRNVELQLKGSGRTPYSREGDGRAVLRSSVREYLASTFMTSLGVPSTGAVGLVATRKAVVMRDQFYDGNARREPAAVVLRTAPTFVRLGTFQILAARGEVGLARALADHVMGRHLQHLSPGDYTSFLAEVCRRNGVTVAHWQSVGFAHGVLNTDNISILGVTIDYGPYGFLDDYDPGRVPNTSDDEGRYAFGRQPEMVRWNLIKFAEALGATILTGMDRGQAEALVEDNYGRVLHSEYTALMLAKLGLQEYQPGPNGNDNVSASDEALVRDLLRLMTDARPDHTRFFRSLARLPVCCVNESGRSEGGRCDASIWDAGVDVKERRAEAQWAGWVARYRRRAAELGMCGERRRALMMSRNPAIQLRNYIAQDVIDSLEGGSDLDFRNLVDALRNPFDPALDAPAGERGVMDRWLGPPPFWAPDVRVSCSS